MNNKKELIVDFDKYNTNIPENVQNKLYEYKKENALEIKALIPGMIIKILVKKNQNVRKGDVLLILEAMKMRNRIYAEIDGCIDDIKVVEGEKVFKGQIMLRLK